jgi:uncharacterized protein (DUF488 family)
MEIYSIGFTQKTAAEFFGSLKKHGVRRLLDVRLNNSSQLAGFAKQADLAFFLKEICDAAYEHELLLAPTQGMLDDYKKHGGDWETYASRFNALIASRRIEERLERDKFQTPTVLLCSEPTAENCHRRLVLEYLRDHWAEIQVQHI